MGAAEARRRIGAVLETVAMGGRLHDKARSLSGGQMRRVESARALLHRPPLLLRDEATVGLDVQSRAGILANVRNLVKTDGISAFWATHLIDEVEEDDHAVVLVEGNLVANAGVADIVRSTGTKNIGEAFSKLNPRRVAVAAEESA
jgi:ABC-2 type transport system ATP-binding protein